MRINQNIMAFNAFRNLTATNNDLGKSLEKLSSGFRINRAADDAAGLVVSEGLRAQVSGLKVAVRNAQDGTSVVQTAEGALTEVHSMLRRMRDLAVQARNVGANDLQARQAAQDEITQLKAEINRVAETTKFGSVTLLDGSYGVTQAEASSTATFTAPNIVAGTNDKFNINVGGGGAVDVTLTANNYAGGETVEDLALDIEQQIRAALYADSQDGSVISVTGTTDATTGEWSISITSSNGVDFVLDDGLIADASDPVLADFNITAANTAYNSSGSGGVFQVGANEGSGERITVAIGNMDTSATGLDIADLDVTTEAGADAAILALDDAIEEVSTQRGQLGALQNRFEHTIANLSVTQENLAASESRIRDTDMALELVTFTRNQILQQAGTAMLAQANQVPQSVLSLLR